MLDSGSEQNWIAKEVLQFVKHSKITTLHLNVKNFVGTTLKKFDLLQIYVATGVHKVDRVGEK